jgi:Uma2 family endonuclease
MVTRAKTYTAGDLRREPTDQPWEVWEGELQEVPGAGQTASELAAVIIAFLLPFVRRRKLGVLTSSDGTYYLSHDPETLVVPDVAFVRWDRLPGRKKTDEYCPVPPDLAVEVVSPSDGPGDIAKKQRLYDGAGVPLVWWVFPRQRSIRVVANGRLVAELGEDDELNGGDVLPGFRLRVAEIFAEV